MADPARKGERIILAGVGAWYAPHEKASLHRMIRGLPSTSETWQQVLLLHGLKAELGASIVDEAEEASIRRAWVAAEQESETPIAARQALEKVA